MLTWLFNGQRSDEIVSSGVAQPLPRCRFQALVAASHRNSRTRAAVAGPGFD